MHHACQHREIIQSTFDASSNGRIHFGQVIGQLVSAGVESYHVDYRSARATCYLPAAETLDLPFDPPGDPIGEAFDAEAIQSAIRGAQQSKVMYPEFKHLSTRWLHRLHGVDHRPPCQLLRAQG